MISHRTHCTVSAIGIALIIAFVFAAIADERTMRVSVQRVEGTPPQTAVIGVSAGYATNPNPSTICFYVEYSDDLTNWKALHSFDTTGTNTQPTLVCTMTYDLTVIFYDLQASRSSNRFYRAVESTP